MHLFKRRRLWVIGGLLGYALLALALVASRNADAATAGLAPMTPIGTAAFDAPTTSSPIALNADKSHIWVVNPDDDSVSVIGNLDGTPSVIATIRVGDEPEAVALGAGVGAYYAYVVNAADNTMSVIHVTASNASSLTATVENTIVTGAEPWNVVSSPDGKRVFVSNSVQDTITVYNAETQSTIGYVDVRNSVCNDPDRSRHFQPRGLAVTLNNDRLFVTRFLSFTGGPAPKQATDDGKLGVVCQLNINTAATTIGGYSVAGAVQLTPQVTGFVDANTAATKAYPNQLQSVVVRGNQAFLPNIAASTSGPLKFNVDTQAFVNVIDNAATGAPADASATKFLNLHIGAQNPEPGKTKLFFANPWAIAFTNQVGTGNAYVVSAGSDLLVKLTVDADGKLAFTGGATTTRYIDLNGTDAANSGANAGKNPLGIVIRSNRAYTMNNVSRNMSVVNLETDAVVQVVKLTNLPKPGSTDEVSLVGKEMFFSSRGVFDRPAGTTVSTRDRLSQLGWQNCASCHFNGGTDGNVWTFNAGPRKSVPLNGTFSPHNTADQRVLNYSAIFDEVQDFEANIRNVSGPGPLAQPLNGSVLDPNHGLLISDTGQINFAPAVLNAFAKPNAGRPQMTVTLPNSNVSVPALDALNEWVKRAIRTPNGALTNQEIDGGLAIADVQAGRKLFFQAGCQACHGGTKWSNSSKDFASPPAAAEIFTETTPPPAAGTNPVTAQYLNRFLRDIKSFDLGSAANPIGANVGAVEKATDGKDALGRDYNGDGKGNGYNIPSLLGIYNLPPYYHNGACETLACVLTNVNHRTSGLKPGASDPLTSASNRAKLELWLQTLDANTAFPTNLRVREHDVFLDPATPFAGAQVTVGVNVELFGTRADLADLANGSPIKVRFVAPGLNTEVELPLAAFTQDFGTAKVTTTWNVPADVGKKTIIVTVDSGNVLNDNPNDNVATRKVQVKNPPADKTAPVVSEVTISDDNPFNPADQIANSPNVKVRFKATDPASPGGGQTSGLDAFCIVRYSFNTSERRWDEEKCDFKALPAADAGTSDTFTVDATLPPRKGAAYAFVWVRDKAGNIVSKPGFDFISVVPGPSEDVTLDRNDTLLIRLRLNAGQSVTVKTALSSGDVDISAFNADKQRVAVSANNGTADESVTVTAPADNSFFQIEIRAQELSVFRITTTQGAMVNLADAVNTIGSRKVVSLEPLTSGPPPDQTAIGDVYDVYLPLVAR